MDDHAFDEDQRIVKEIAGRFGPPSFMRRAKQVETSWTDLLSRLAGLRLKHLEMVRLRLGQLSALAADWERLRAWLPDDDDRTELQRLHEALKPRLRMPLERTSSGRELRSALAELLEAMNAFNRRWSKVLAETDLKPVNDIREAYNRYYLLEKECALGSARVARMDFQRVEAATVADLFREFPLLKLPRLAV